MNEQNILNTASGDIPSLIDILKKLTMMDGVSGDEKPVRDFIIERIRIGWIPGMWIIWET